MFFTKFLLFLGFSFFLIFYIGSLHLLDLKFLIADLPQKNITIFTIAQAQTEDNSTSNKRPPPPPRVPPNRVKPGGGLDFARQSCIKNSASLTALVPVDNPVLTTQPYPSFLFYIPDTSAAIRYGEFALFTADEKQRIYSTTVNFTQTPGIIKIDIPPSEQYALQEETYYHWYFRVYCQDASNPRTSLDVNGWIRRVSLTTTRKSQIEAVSPDIWYDAIAQVADNLITLPHSSRSRDRWIELLQHINLEHLADYPIVDVPQKQVGKTEKLAR